MNIQRQSTANGQALALPEPGLWRRNEHQSSGASADPRCEWRIPDFSGDSRLESSIQTFIDLLKHTEINNIDFYQYTRIYVYKYN